MTENSAPLGDAEVGGRWSLKGRLLRWLGFTASVAALTLTIAGAWFLHSAASRQLDALLQEELDELSIAFRFEDIDVVRFEEVARDLNALHAGTPMAWRVWNPGGETLLGEFGALGTLLSDAPALEPRDTTVRTADGYRWRTTQLRDGYVVGVLIDEVPHFTLLREYGFVAVALMLIGFGSIFLVGRFFASHVSAMLERIATQARGVQAASENIQISREGLPDEMREVVEALDEMLGNIRVESEKSRILVAGIAHELRSPIQNLIGETEVALFSDHDADEYRALLNSHLDEMRDLRDAVQNLVALCSAGRAAASKSVEEFELIEESRIRLGRQLKRAEREGVALVIHASSEALIHGDREALMTGIRNIVSNAIDWTPEGGRIDVNFEGDESRAIITIDDTGPGVPEELGLRIFEPFVRGRAAEGQRIGYGLGLALAHSAVLAQSGSIEVLSSPSGGARFRISLPLQRGATADARAE